MYIPTFFEVVKALFLLWLAVYLIRWVFRIRHMFILSKHYTGPAWKFPYGNINLFYSFPHAGEALKSQIKEHGRTFRLWSGPTQPLLVTTDPGLMKFMQVTERNRFDIGERPELYFSTGNSLLTSVGKLWQKQRQLLNPAFHFNQLTNMTQIFNEHVKTCLRHLDAAAQSGKPVDINRILSHLTLDIIGESAFGTKLQAQESGTLPLLKSFEMILRRNENTGAAGFESLLATLIPPFLIPSNWGTIPAIFSIRRHVRKTIAARQKEMDEKGEHNAPRDLLGLLLSCKDENGKRMSLRQMVDESMAFWLAGHETTSTLMTWLLYALSLNPAVDAKLHQSLASHKEALTSHEGPSHNDLKDLDYLQQVIDETLRMYPAVPYVPRRALADMQYNGKPIPQGTWVLMNTYAIHRDETYYPNPTEFQPERFSKQNAGAREKFVFNPFSHGPRHCIGQNFAMLEARALLSQILLQYRFELVPNQKVIPRILIVMRPKDPLMMTVHKRAVPT